MDLHHRSIGMAWQSCCSRRRRDQFVEEVLARGEGAVVHDQVDFHFRIDYSVDVIEKIAEGVGVVACNVLGRHFSGMDVQCCNEWYRAVPAVLELTPAWLVGIAAFPGLWMAVFSSTGSTKARFPPRGLIEAHHTDLHARQYPP